MLKFWIWSSNLNQQCFSCDGKQYCIVFRQRNRLLLFFPCLISPLSHFHVSDCCWELQEPSLLWTLWINSTCHLSYPLARFPLTLSQPSFRCQQTTLGLCSSFFKFCFHFPLSKDIQIYSVYIYYIYFRTCIFRHYNGLSIKHNGCSVTLWIPLNQSNRHGGHSYT